MVAQHLMWSIRRNTSTFSDRLTNLGLAASGRTNARNTRVAQVGHNPTFSEREPVSSWLPSRRAFLNEFSTSAIPSPTELPALSPTESDMGITPTVFGGKPYRFLMYI
jgi:hypothetical protein